MRVQEVMSAAGFTSHGKPVRDEAITVACDECQTFSRLSECRIKEFAIEEEGHKLDVTQTEYTCPCGETVMTVGPPLYLSGGLQLAEWTILPTSSMEIDVPMDPEGH